MYGAYDENQRWQMEELFGEEYCASNFDDWDNSQAECCEDLEYREWERKCFERQKGYGKNTHAYDQGIDIDQLPVFRTNRCGWTPEILYAAVMDMVNGKTTPPITPFGEHKAFMAFADFQIENMAEHLEMKSGRELLKLLDQYHLLYLTNSSRGYQSRVYVDGNNRD